MKKESKGIKLDKRQLVLLSIIGGLLFIFIMDKLIFSGMRSKLKELKQKITLEEATLRDGFEIEGRKDEITGDYQRYLPYLKSEGSEKEVMTRFLKEMEEVIQDSGGSVIALTPRTESFREKDYTKYLADLQIEATLEQIFKFLSKIQQSKLLLKIDSFSLSPRGEGAGTFKMDAAVSIAILSDSTK